MTQAMTSSIQRTQTLWMSRRNWRIRTLLACHIIAALLVVSWFWQPTRAVWDRLDAACFYLLNGTLDWGGWWVWLWAATNTRRWDTLSGVIMICLLMIYMFGYRPRLRQRMAKCAFIGLYLLAVVGLTREMLFNFFPVVRYSPTLVLEPAIMLSDLMPHLDPKDDSRGSFPGDHGTVCAIFTVLVWYFAGWRFGLITALLSVFLVLPRLVGGAHWLTDLTIGSVVIALLFLSWALATPFHRWARYHMVIAIGRVGKAIPFLRHQPANE